MLHPCILHQLLLKPDGEPDMSGGGYSLDDGLDRHDKTRECQLRMRSVDVTSMWRRKGEVVEMVARWRLDFCCIQESRWKSEGAKVLGSESMKCKLFWKGCDSGNAGVGVIVSERWISHIIIYIYIFGYISSMSYIGYNTVLLYHIYISLDYK